MGFICQLSKGLMRRFGEENRRLDFYRIKKVGIQSTVAHRGVEPTFVVHLHDFPTAAGADFPDEGLWHSYVPDS